MNRASRTMCRKIIHTRGRTGWGGGESDDGVIIETGAPGLGGVEVSCTVPFKLVCRGSRREGGRVEPGPRIELVESYPSLGPAVTPVALNGTVVCVLWLLPDSFLGYVCWHPMLRHPVQPHPHPHPRSWFIVDDNLCHVKPGNITIFAAGRK